MLRRYLCFGLLIAAGPVCGGVERATLVYASDFLPRLQQDQPPTSSPSSASQGQSTPVQEESTLDDEIIQDVLEPLRTGMETQNTKLVLSAFDPQALPDYGHLRGQLTAFFNIYNEVRFRYQLLQAAAENDHASATVDLGMDALPYETTHLAARRHAQMRLQLKRGAKGWKITAFTPSGFFATETHSSDFAR